MKNSRKILGLLLALVLIATMIPTVGMAATTTTSKYVTVDLSSGNQVKAGTHYYTLKSDYDWDANTFTDTIYYQKSKTSKKVKIAKFSGANYYSRLQQKIVTNGSKAYYMVTNDQTVDGSVATYACKLYSVDVTGKNKKLLKTFKGESETKLQSYYNNCLYLNSGSLKTYNLSTKKVATKIKGDNYFGLYPIAQSSDGRYLTFKVYTWGDETAIVYDCKNAKISKKLTIEYSDTAVYNGRIYFINNDLAFGDSDEGNYYMNTTTIYSTKFSGLDKKKEAQFVTEGMFCDMVEGYLYYYSDDSKTTEDGFTSYTIPAQKYSIADGTLTNIPDDEFWDSVYTAGSW